MDLFLVKTQDLSVGQMFLEQNLTYRYLATEGLLSHFNPHTSGTSYRVVFAGGGGGGLRMWSCVPIGCWGWAGWG